MHRADSPQICTAAALPADTPACGVAQAIFALRLLTGLGGLERSVLVALVPLSVLGSLLGFAASVWSYVRDAHGGGGGLR